MELISRNITKKYDVAVVGGGMAGICAAMAAARHGARVALIQNRPMLGGNASSEIRMHICGANCQISKKDVNETGILLELLLANKSVNPRFNYNLWDAVLIDKVNTTPGLDLYLNTVMHRVKTEGDKIKSVTCYRQTTEQTFVFEAPYFIDATGHGTLGFFAGADWRSGSEGREEFGECLAPGQPTDAVMGNTLLFKAVNAGHPVKFVKPGFANTYTEEQLKHRIHYNYRGVLNGDVTSEDKSGRAAGLPELYNVDYGYWWLEIGNDSGDIIAHGEEIRDELMKCLWGIWDHIKNGGEHGAANYDLAWCGIVPGTRDSRRLVGDYLLNENDIEANRVFDDAVAYGGWPMDVHSAGGFHDLGHSPSTVYNFDGLYTIPYRSYYSHNICNLFMAGRDISATKMGMSSARVMATCAVGGQAAGTAASLCVRHGCSPRELGRGHIRELQTTLIRDDCYIPGFGNNDEKDIARLARVSAGSERPGFECGKVINGVTRRIGGESNCWQSDGIREGGETLRLELKEARKISEVRVIFDPDLSCEMVITLSGKKQDQQIPVLPPELIKDYSVRLTMGGRTVAVSDVSENCVRLAVHKFPGVEADAVEIVCRATYGAPDAHVYEVRIYEENQD